VDDPAEGEPGQRLRVRRRVERRLLEKIVEEEEVEIDLKAGCPML
jgi:hypothetical protein